MNYTSTVTSKGTITLPASIRKKLGITPGKEVDISVRGDTITVRQKGSWEEVFAFGDKLKADLKKRGKSLPTSDDELKRQVDAIKIKEYRQKYGL